MADRLKDARAVGEKLRGITNEKAFNRANDFLRDLRAKRWLNRTIALEEIQTAETALATALRQNCAEADLLSDEHEAGIARELDALHVEMLSLLAPYTVEIAEQLGWKLPDNVVVPMAGGSLIRKIRKAFNELIYLGLVEDKPVRFFGAQATGCSPISQAVKEGTDHITPQKPNTIARSLAIGNPADGPQAAKMIRETGGWAEDVSDVEVVSGMQELAETEGIFTETAGGVTTAVTARLFAQGRISPDETTVVCITGNGLKTTDAVTERYEQGRAVRPRLADFDEYLRELDGAAAIAAEPELVVAGGR